MKETTNITSVGGKPLTLLGEPIQVGLAAPNFMAVNIKSEPVNLTDFKGKIVVISVFPSIDTGVCALQTKRFNKEASAWGNDVVLLTISKDLPFALGRFCGAEGIDNSVVLSDYMDSEFGLKYGFLIKENKLLTRGVVIVDQNNQVAYVEYVPDITQEPNYSAVLKTLSLLNNN